MDRNQYTSVSLVPRPASIQRSKQTISTYGRNPWIPNEYRQSFSTSSFTTHDNDSSLNDPYLSMSRCLEEGRMENKNIHYPSFSTPVYPFQSDVRRTDGHEMGRNSKAQLFLSTLWYTTVSLTILLLTMYLFLLDLKTSTKYTDQTPSNIIDSSITTKRPYICSGVAPYTSWTLFFTIGLRMTINTSNCSFNSTPLYFTSLAGNGKHWNVGGYGAIYVATPNSFTIFTEPLTTYSNTDMLNSSQIYSWDVNWIGILE